MQCARSAFSFCLFCLLAVCQVKSEGTAGQEMLKQSTGMQSSSESSSEQLPSSKTLSSRLDESWEAFDKLLIEQEEYIQALETGLNHTESLMNSLSLNLSDLKGYASELETASKARDVALFESYRDLDRLTQESERRFKLLVGTWVIVGLLVALRVGIWYIRKK